MRSLCVNGLICKIFDFANSDSGSSPSGVRRKIIMSFFEKVYEVVKKIPKGRVATYGQIACLAGSPRSARQVGYALHVNPEPFVIPCHRVVNRFGSLAPAFAFGGVEVQAALLRDEGVEVTDDGFVDLEKYIWKTEN